MKLKLKPRTLALNEKVGEWSGSVNRRRDASENFEFCQLELQQIGVQITVRVLLILLECNEF